MSLFADPVAERLNEMFLLEKAGPEGYVHGWDCVVPPCGKPGGRIHHPEHGTGVIGRNAEGQLTGNFADGFIAPLGEPAVRQRFSSPSHNPYRRLVDRMTNPGGTRYDPAVARAAENFIPHQHPWPKPREVAEGIAEGLNPLAGSVDTPLWQRTVDPADSVAAHRVRSRAEVLGQHAGFWNA